MKIKTIILITFCLLFTREAFAQDIEVKKFGPIAKDQTANVESKEGYQWNDVWISEGLIKEGLEGCKKYF